MLKRHIFTPLVPCFILILTLGCGGADINIVNRVKTFSPKWALLNENYNYIERNLDFIEKKFNKQKETVVPHAEQKIKKRHSKKKALIDYIEEIESQAHGLDSLRTVFGDDKKTFLKSVKNFYAWEEQVMEGNLSNTQALTDLSKYKKVFNKLEGNGKKIQSTLHSTVMDHNRTYRSISKILKLHANFDLSIK